MAKDARSSSGLHIAEAAYAAFLLLWYFIPYVTGALGTLRPLEIAGAVYGSPPGAAGAWAVVTVLAWAAPVIALWKIASVFLARPLPLLADPRWLVPILLDLVASGVVVLLFVITVVHGAATAAWFLTVPLFTYAVTLLSLAFNGFFLVRLIGSVSSRDASYQEYVEFRRRGEGEAGAHDRLLASVPRAGIQRKLLLTFVPLILLVIVVLSFSLLRDFKRTILAAIYANGQGLAERTASVVKSNPGDLIALTDYLLVEGKKNDAAAGQNASFRFTTMDIVIGGAKTGFRQLSLRSGVKDVAETKPKSTEPEFAQPLGRYNDADTAWEFLAPVTLSGKFIGYVKVSYARDVIYEPYFRTQVLVLVIAALFMYASVFLTYFLGRAIVFPILFLRMSVKSIADLLSRMINGTQRPSAELLQYKDRVTTHDEIKQLSGEVGHMTSVIRGVIPYISASTLKHAGAAAPVSENKELACLFTDIRGFTDMSEKMPPDKVVEMLNHYLEIETSIIHANEGDVDKYVGDAMFARFDGPRKEYNACRAGLEIRRAMIEEARKAREASQQAIDIGIGIHAGMVTFGSVGAQERKDFTAIGDNVNLASRLESANKPYHVKSLLSESVYEKVKDDFLCREIDLLAVKGKTEGVRVYEIIREAAGATDRDERFRKLFETSLGLYRKQRWDSAEKGFRALVKDHDDATSQVFLERIEVMRADPPGKGWDGVYRMKTKG